MSKRGDELYGRNDKRRQNRVWFNRIILHDKKVLAVMAELADMGADIYPILSPAVANTDTRFGTAKEIYDAVHDISGKKPMTALTDVEPIGPKKLIDVLVIAPCTWEFHIQISKRDIRHCSVFSSKVPS